MLPLFLNKERVVSILRLSLGGNKKKWVRVPALGKVGIKEWRQFLFYCLTFHVP